MNHSVDAVGVDIGGTKVAAGRVDDHGVVREVAYAPTPPRTAEPQAVEDAIVSAITRVAGSAEVPVGIGAAGFVDADRRRVRFAPHVSWRDEPLAERLHRRLGRPVVVENDANAAAWAEYRFGAGRGQLLLLMITLGTGIGGAIVLDGQVQRGVHGMAGEFGHMTAVPGGRECECGKRGCWEQYASGSAVRHEALARLSDGPPPESWARQGMDLPERVTGTRVSDLAVDGDEAAREVLATVGTWLGRGVADLVAAFDPGLVIVGGGAAQSGGLLLHPAREALQRHLSGRGYRDYPEIVPAAMGADAGLIGAADLARGSAGDASDPRS